MQRIDICEKNTSKYQEKTQKPNEKPHLKEKKDKEAIFSVLLKNKDK